MRRPRPAPSVAAALFSALLGERPPAYGNTGLRTAADARARNGGSARKRKFRAGRLSKSRMRFGRPR